MDLWTHIVCNKAANILELEWNISHYSELAPIHAWLFCYSGEKRPALDTVSIKKKKKELKLHLKKMGHSEEVLHLVLRVGIYFSSTSLPQSVLGRHPLLIVKAEASEC